MELKVIDVYKMDAVKSMYTELKENPRNLDIKLAKYPQQGFLLQLPGEEKAKRLKGITPIIAEIFWPNYKFRKFVHSSGTITGLNRPEEGIIRGKMVHDQLEHFINMEDHKYRAFIRSKYKGIEHEYVMKIIGYLSDRNLTPKVAEFPIYDEKIGIATAIDAICVNNVTKKLAIVDWKVGMDDYVGQGSAPLLRPPSLTKFANSPLHQAYIQLLVEVQILERRYGICPDEVFVIRVDQSGVTKYSVPQEFMKARKEIYDCVVEHMEKLKIEKFGNKKQKRKKEEPSSKEAKKLLSFIDAKEKSGKIGDSEASEFKQYIKKVLLDPPKKTFFGKKEAPKAKPKPKSKPKPKPPVEKVKKEKGPPKKKIKRKPVDPDLVGVKFPEPYDLT
jgi:hypothetical protein